MKINYMICYVMIYMINYDIWYDMWYIHDIFMSEKLFALPSQYIHFCVLTSQIYKQGKIYSFVVSAISRSRFRQHLPVVPSEYHSLLEGIPDAGWVWAFDSSERYVTTRNWSLLFFGEYLVSWGLVMGHNWRRDIPEIILRILYILTFWHRSFTFKF
jgi:hypothetical protein